MTLAERYPNTKPRLVSLDLLRGWGSVILCAEPSAGVFVPVWVENRRGVRTLELIRRKEFDSIAARATVTP